MTDKDFEVVCSKIEEEKEFLNTISQDIWKTPELNYREAHAHALLTCALKKHGFKVHKHYFIPTAFRAEYPSKLSKLPTVAFLLEFDALPDIGHGCGHNLIAEAGLAAAIGAKAAMDQDPTIAGKIVVLGTPAEEGGGGKIKLLELGAFEDIDVALMVHPAPFTELEPCFVGSVLGSADFKTKEIHPATSHLEGTNALDAAVACYQNIAQLKKHIKPNSRVNALITKSATAVNVIPAESSMEFIIRSSELRDVVDRVKDCIVSAAEATSCEMEYSILEEDAYENLITNKPLIATFKRYLERLGVADFDRLSTTGFVASTDMGNVSQRIPSIHPLYTIPSSSMNHSKGFTAASGADTAQEPTLRASKAMALTALHVMRCPDTLKEVRDQFALDVQENL